MCAGPENKDGQGEGTCPSSCVPLRFFRFPGTPHPSWALSPGSRHLASTHCLRMVLRPQKTLSHIIPAQMVLEEPPTSTQAPSAPPFSEPPTSAQACTSVSQPGTPPKPTQGAQSPNAHTPCRVMSSGAALGGKSLANPRPALRSQPTALLELLQAEPPPTPTAATALSSPGEHLLTRGKMGVGVGEAGGEQSPTHLCFSPLAPQTGPQTPHHCLAHADLQNSASVGFHALPLPGPVNTPPAVHPF